MVQLSQRTIIHFTIFALLYLIIWLFVKYSFQTSTMNKTFLGKLIQRQLPSKSTPTIARVLYLFLCENQAEINAYTKAFPSITADVMFLCWKEDCTDATFSQLPTFYAVEWSGRVRNDRPFIRFDSVLNYTMIKPRVFIINERQLNLTRKTTWTTARNILYERALIEEVIKVGDGLILLLVMVIFNSVVHSRKTYTRPIRPMVMNSLLLNSFVL